MINVGTITGSGIYALPGATELRRVETRFGEVELSLIEVGPWKVGAVSRHGGGHRHLPHTIFTDPGDGERGHLVTSDPFVPRLRARVELASRALGLEPTVGGVYGHTNSPRFETAVRYACSERPG